VIKLMVSMNSDATMVSIRVCKGASWWLQETLSRQVLQVAGQQHLLKLMTAFCACV
jgi:hypothetical protein